MTGVVLIQDVGHRFRRSSNAALLGSPISRKDALSVGEAVLPSLLKRRPREGLSRPNPRHSEKGKPCFMDDATAAKCNFRFQISR